MICIIKGAIIGPLCLYVSQGKVDLEKTKFIENSYSCQTKHCFFIYSFQEKDFGKCWNEHEFFTSGIFELNFEKVHMIVTLHLDKKEYKKCTWYNSKYWTGTKTKGAQDKNETIGQAGKQKVHEILT